MSAKPPVRPYVMATVDHYDTRHDSILGSELEALKNGNMKESSSYACQFEPAEIVTGVRSLDPYRKPSLLLAGYPAPLCVVTDSRFLKQSNNGGFPLLPATGNK